MCGQELLCIFIDDVSGNIGNAIYIDIDSGPPCENEPYVVASFYAV